MPHPDPTSKLPKWPFLIGDAALLGAAWLIAARSEHPFPPEVTISIASCAIIATVAGVIPFLADYARRQEEALDERQRALESLAHTVSASAQQISIAVRGFQEMAEQAQVNLKPAAPLPPLRDDEKEKLKKELAARRSDEAERLESAADKIARAAADWARLETASQKHLAAARTVVAELDEKSARIKAIQSAAPVAEVPAAAALEPVLAIPPKEAAPAPRHDPAFAVGAADLSSDPSAEISSELLAKPDASPKAPRKRAPKKPPVESPLPAAEPAVLESLPALEFSPPAADDAFPTVTFAADGATRLLVTAYIGIGNRLFIRGDGPGLSWERGAPLQFVSIGKWRWESADATSPVNFKLYKNDEVECTALEGRPLAPGHQQEVVATF